MFQENRKLKTGLLLIGGGIALALSPGLIPCSGPGCSSRAGLLITLPLGGLIALIGLIRILVGLGERKIPEEKLAKRALDSKKYLNLGFFFLGLAFLIDPMVSSLLADQQLLVALHIIAYGVPLSFVAGLVFLIIGFANKR